MELDDKKVWKLNHLYRDEPESTLKAKKRSDNNEVLWKINKNCLKGLDYEVAKIVNQRLELWDLKKGCIKGRSKNAP